MAMNDLKICSWNIHGYNSRHIGNKLLSEAFLDIINGQDIVSLTETRIHEEILEHLIIPVYKRICHKNQTKKLKISHCRGGGGGGRGIATFVKEHLAKLFSYVHSDDEDTVWVKFKNDVSAKGSSNIFLGTLYISPSAPNADKTQKPLETVASFQAKGEVSFH